MAYDSGDAKSRGPIELAVSAVFIALSWVTLLLRVYVRARMIKSLGWDDYLMIVTVILYTSFCATLIKMTTLGGGSFGVSFERMQTAVYYVIANEDEYLITMVFLKLSLGMFFLRLVIKKWQRWMIYGALTLSTLVHFAHIWIITFLCGNPKNFLVKYMDKKCIPENVQLGLAYEQASVATFTDILLFCTPILILRDSQMNMRSKISVGAIMSLGALGVLGSIVRFIYIPGLIGYTNFFWNSANYAIWSTIEPGTGIVAGNLACLRPLLKHILQEAKTTLSHSRNRSTDSNASQTLHRRPRVTASTEKMLPTATSGSTTRKSSASAQPSSSISHSTTIIGNNNDAPWAASKGETTTTCIGGPSVPMQSFLGEVREDDVEMASRHQRWSSMERTTSKRERVYTKLRSKESLRRKSPSRTVTTTTTSATNSSGHGRSKSDKSWSVDLERGINVRQVLETSGSLTRDVGKQEGGKEMESPVQGRRRSLEGEENAWIAGLEWKNSGSSGRTRYKEILPTG